MTIKDEDISDLIGTTFYKLEFINGNVVQVRTDTIYRDKPISQYSDSEIIEAVRQEQELLDNDIELVKCRDRLEVIDDIYCEIRRRFLLNMHVLRGTQKELDGKICCLEEKESI